jgi:hypothetical protein
MTRIGDAIGLAVRLDRLDARIERAGQALVARAAEIRAAGRQVPPTLLGRSLSLRAAALGLGQYCPVEPQDLPRFDAEMAQWEAAGGDVAWWSDAREERHAESGEAQRLALVSMSSGEVAALASARKDPSWRDPRAWYVEVHAARRDEHVRRGLEDADADWSALNDLCLDRSELGVYARAIRARRVQTVRAERRKREERERERSESA